MQPADDELITESEELDGVAELGLMPSVECCTTCACACPTASTPASTIRGGWPDILGSWGRACTTHQP